ncbi:hypothetical protein BAR153v2_001290 [Bartonella sp. AR 15-3]|nr:hypothetical protein BAR153v2_001290 [Bartonella sp. AR 15-3]CBI78797.1 hypothetical protein BAR15_100025 [Bartonella sp. AR 15-3]
MYGSITSNYIILDNSYDVEFIKLIHKKQLEKYTYFLIYDVRIQ